MVMVMVMVMVVKFENADNTDVPSGNIDSLSSYPPPLPHVWTSKWHQVKTQRQIDQLSGKVQVYVSPNENLCQVRDQVNESTAKKHIFRKGDNSRAVAEMSEASFSFLFPNKFLPSGRAGLCLLVTFACCQHCKCGSFDPWGPQGAIFLNSHWFCVLFSVL